jgi:hypothetical protein
MDFVIIASARTGSTMLCNYLDSQQNIKCHYELFIRDRIQLSTDNGRKHDIMVSKIDEDEVNHDNLVKDIMDNNLLETRYDDTIKLFDILKKHNKKPFLGFKMMYGHIKLFNSFDFYDYLIKNNIKVIHLYRENKFLQELSNQKKQKTGISTIFQYEEYPNKKIIFDIKHYINERASKEWNYKIHDKLFHLGNIPNISVTYEDLCGSNKIEHYKRIFEFITGSTNSFTEIKDQRLQYKKINTFTLEDQIENFEEVNLALKNDIFFKKCIHKG